MAVYLYLFDVVHVDGHRHNRSGDWLKFKCVNQQEFVTVPLDRRADFEDMRGFARDVAEELPGRSLSQAHKRLNALIDEG